MKSLLTIFAVSLSFAVSAQKVQCKGITQTGKQCSRMTDKVYCYQHIRSNDNSIKTIVASKAQCTAITKKGTQCSRNAQSGKTTCFQHSK